VAVAAPLGAVMKMSRYMRPAILALKRGDISAIGLMSRFPASLSDLQSNLHCQWPVTGDWIEIPSDRFWPEEPNGLSKTSR
jgi:hypothetical protein